MTGYSAKLHTRVWSLAVPIGTESQPASVKKLQKCRQSGDSDGTLTRAHNPSLERTGPTRGTRRTAVKSCIPYPPCKYAEAALQDEGSCPALLDAVAFMPVIYTN